MNIGIMPHTRKPAALELAKTVIDFLQSREIRLWVEQSAATLVHHPELAGDAEDLVNMDAIIVLGGDGALLNATRMVAEMDVPVLGVNVGHLGFLTELESEDIIVALEKLIAGDYTVENRMFIEARLLRDGTEVVRYRALNDAVITRGTFARIIRLSTSVDGQHVIDYIADGIIVATPTGSTAYSLSAGGPIVEPFLECLVITPICPHTLAARSVLVRPEAVVSVEVEAAHEDVMLTIDGQMGFRLKSGDQIRISRATENAKFLKLRGRNFFEILHSRLTAPLPIRDG